MKKIISLFILLTTILTLSFRQSDNYFIPKKINGFNYLFATTISIKSFREFDRMISLNKINRVELTEQQSDTTDVLNAEQILKADLDSFLMNRIKRKDTIMSYNRQQSNEYKSIYNSLRKHTRQIKSLTSDNKRYICINLFCEYTAYKELMDIQYRRWIQARDGGDCFWQIIVDLTDKKIIDTHENGVG